MTGGRLVRMAAAAALLLTACGVALAGPIAPLRPLVVAPSPESELVSAMELAAAGRTREGARALEDLIRRQPNFRLAQLLYADLLAARSGVRGIMADAEDPRVLELFDEARLRLDQARFNPEPGSVPDTVLQLSAEYPYLVLVDLPRSRLHLMKNVDGYLQPVGSRYASIGRAGYGKQVEGDLRTPVGIYHVTGWMNDQALPELYGAGALPLNYPNLWDRLETRTGYGIWLHGVPRQTYVRAPRSSEGCVTMANDDLEWLRPFVEKSRAPVVLAEELEWIPQAKAREERVEFLQRIEDWRRAWAAMDNDTYLDFYGEDFVTAGQDKTRFAQHKRRVNAEKRFIDVEVSDISLFRYPGERMILAEFTLDYRSDNFDFSAKKEQYWRQDPQGQWRIFREENR